MPYIFQRDTAGVGEVLKAMAADAVIDLALEVAASAGTAAVVESRTGKKRYIAQILVPADQQAKDGVLSRAAADAGLTIRSYPKRAPRKKTEKPAAPKPARTTKADAKTTTRKPRSTKKPSA